MGIIVGQQNPKRVEVEKKPYGAVYVKAATETPVTEQPKEDVVVEQQPTEVVADAPRQAVTETRAEETTTPKRRVGRKPKRK